METPLSTRRVTRSQTMASKSNNTIPISNFDKSFSNSRPMRKEKQQQSQQDRLALFDITNDSPIVGLATGSLETPSSAFSKNRSSFLKMTPGSGEALLRGQVKTLLQKVEEEAELSKLSLESRSVVHNLKGFVHSPAGILAPTPANTPQLLNLSGGDGDQSLNSMDKNNDLASENETPSRAIGETLISQVTDDKEQEESLESHKSIITRSLLLDFFEKSDISDSAECPSVLTYQDTDTESKEKPTPDDDSASIWSVQVTVSSLCEEVEEFEFEEREDCYDEVGEKDKDDELVDELCEFISKITMNEKNELPKFEGKHKRFMYNSDDEMVEDKESNAASPSIVCLNGLPTPKGKHLRFSEE